MSWGSVFRCSSLLFLVDFRHFYLLSFYRIIPQYMLIFAIRSYIGLDETVAYHYQLTFRKLRRTLSGLSQLHMQSATETKIGGLLLLRMFISA